MNPEVLRLIRPYLDAVAWSTLPLLLYFAFRRYLQGLGVVRPIMVTLIVANLMNVVANWALIYGQLGAAGARRRRSGMGDRAGADGHGGIAAWS